MSGGEGRIVVTFSALEEGARDVETISGQIARQLADLKSYLKPLTSTWHGQAAINNQTLQQLWDQSGEDLNQVLALIARMLHGFSHDYHQTENRASSVWDH